MVIGKAAESSVICPVDEFVCNRVVDLVFHWYYRQKTRAGRRQPARCPPSGIESR
jgi:hypothetical protein